MDYFSLGTKITEDFLRNLTGVNPNIGFLIAGGFGYDSIKYKDDGQFGDYDFLCLVDKPSDIKRIISDRRLLSKMGFDINRAKDFYEEDINLFEKGIISIIGYSSYVDGQKTSINFSTFKRIYSLIENPDEKFYKIRHNEPFNLFIAKGTNGEDLIACRISPEVSTLYKDGKKHFLLPNHAWLHNGDSIHLGIYTDMISKGKIAYDNKEEALKKIQTLIWEQMVNHASPDIIENKNWHKMFANSHYFSASFITKIDKTLDSLNLKNNRKTSGKVYKSKLKNNSLVVIFADNKYYSSKMLSENSKKMLFERVDPQDYLSISEIIRKDTVEEIDFMSKLHFINAESNRLSNLLSLSNNNQVELPEKLDSDSIFINSKDLFYYSETKRIESDMYKSLSDSIKKDNETLVDINSNLFKYFQGLRMQVLTYMHRK